MFTKVTVANSIFYTLPRDNYFLGTTENAPDISMLAQPQNV